MRWTWVLVLLWPSWASATQPSGSSDTWGVWSAWAILCLSIVVFAMVRWKQSREPATPPQVRIRGRLSLGPRREIIVVEAAGTTLICASTEHGIHTLGAASDAGGQDA